MGQLLTLGCLLWRGREGNEQSIYVYTHTEILLESRVQSISKQLAAQQDLPVFVALFSYFPNTWKYIQYLSCFICCRNRLLFAKCISKVLAVVLHRGQISRSLQKIGKANLQTWSESHFGCFTNQSAITC